MGKKTFGSGLGEKGLPLLAAGGLLLAALAGATRRSSTLTKPASLGEWAPVQPEDEDSFEICYPDPADTSRTLVEGPSRVIRVPLNAEATVSRFTLEWVRFELDRRTSGNGETYPVWVRRAAIVSVEPTRVYRFQRSESRATRSSVSRTKRLRLASGRILEGIV